MIIRRFLIFLVGISIIFNNVAVVPGVSVGLFASAAYFVSMFEYLPELLKVGKYYGSFLWNILFYIVFFTIINAININAYNTPVFPFSIFMCFILMLFILIHNIYDRKALSYCLYGMALGGVLMSIFFALGIGVEIGLDLRVVMFGENSNALGIYMGLSSMVILYNIILRDELKLKAFRFLFLLIFFPIVSLLFATGSRTAFLIFALSVIVIIAFFPTKSKFTKLAFMTIGIVCCIFAFSKLITSESILIERLTTTVEDGNTSGRDGIAEALIPYIFDSPIWGYGQTGYVDVAKKALGKVSVFGNTVYGYSPHNVILEVLLYTGFIGLTLWIVFWWNIGKEAWVLFRKRRLIMPALMCIPILACILSGQLLTSKWAFILYAFIMSEYYYYRNIQIQ